MSMGGKHGQTTVRQKVPSLITLQKLAAVPCGAVMNLCATIASSPTELAMVAGKTQAA